MKEKFLNFLEHIQFFSMSQFGFMRGQSIDTSLFRHITDVTDCLEQNKFAVGVYLDLAKAFDTVDHSRLILKLKGVGINGPLLG